jgi:hypothetical protein
MNKNFLVFILVFLSSNCYGMEDQEGKQGGKLEKLNKATQRFHKKSKKLHQKTKEEHEETKRKRNQWLYDYSFGLFGNVSNRTRDTTTTESTDYTDQRASLIAQMQQLQTQLQESDNTKLEELIERSQDLEASSKQFLLQVKQKKQFIQLDYTLIRSLLGLTGCGISLWVGLHGLSHKSGNKNFALCATLIGATGSAGMLYDLYKKAERTFILLS